MSEIDSLFPFFFLGFLVSGDVTKKLDPFFPFEKSVERWGRSFAAMNIGYAGMSSITPPCPDSTPDSRMTHA